MLTTLLQPCSHRLLSNGRDQLARFRVADGVASESELRGVECGRPVGEHKTIFGSEGSSFPILLTLVSQTPMEVRMAWYWSQYRGP